MRSGFSSACGQKGERHGARTVALRAQRAHLGLLEQERLVGGAAALSHEVEVVLAPLCTRHACVRAHNQCAGKALTRLGRVDLHLGGQVAPRVLLVIHRQRRHLPEACRVSAHTLRDTDSSRAPGSSAGCAGRRCQKRRATAPPRRRRRSTRTGLSFPARWRCLHMGGGGEWPDGQVVTAVFHACRRTCVLAARQDHASSHVCVLKELQRHEPVVGRRLRGG